MAKCGLRANRNGVRHPMSGARGVVRGLLGSVATAALASIAAVKSRGVGESLRRRHFSWRLSGR